LLLKEEDMEVKLQIQSTEEMEEMEGQEVELHGAV